MPNCSAMTKGAWLGSMMPAGADADRRGAGADIGKADRGGGAGDAGHGMMLGHPETPVAELFGVAREIEGVAQRLSGVAALDDRSEGRERTRGS